MSATNALLEREAELVAIDELLAAAHDGAGGALTIEGEAGAGKTTLLEAAGRRAAEQGMLVLRARAGEYERDFPYGVVRQLFEPILGDAQRRAELLNGSAALAAPVFEAQASPQDASEPFAVQHGLYWLVANLAAARPLALLVDDAQWADFASLRALTYIGRRLDELAAALAFTVRTGEPGEHMDLLGELRREPAGRTIRPRPLSSDAAATLLAAEVDSRPTDLFVETCCRVTAGNPFLLVELLSALESENLSPTDENADRLTQVAAADVSHSILGRLGRLGGHAIDVARAAAVLEPNAEIRLVAALAGLPTSVVAHASEQLVAARLLVDARPLAYVHPLVRAAVLSDLSEPQRAMLHARSARLLAESDAALDTVAAHLLLAEPDDDEWACAQLRAAAAAALDRAAPDAAVRYLRRALREPPPREERLTTSRELGVALLRATDEEGVEVLRTVRSAVGDPGARAEIAIELALSFGLRMHGEEAVSMLKESLAEISDRRSSLGVKLRGFLLLLVFWGYRGLPEDALPEPGETFDLDTHEGRLIVQVTAGLYAFGLGSIEEAREMAEASIVNREAFLADAMAGLPPTGALLTLALSDRGELVKDPFEIAIEAAARRGALLGAAGARGPRCFCHLFDGELHDAQADAETALRVALLAGFPVSLSIWLSGVLKTLVARGDFSAAEKLLDETWRDRELPRGFAGALLICARGELRLATGRHAEARHDFLAVAERLSFLPYPNPEALGWRTGLATCEAMLGNPREAQNMAAEAVELARKAGGQRGIGVAMRVQGAIVGGTEGISLLREAAGLLSTTRARLQHAYALADLGAALRRANKRKEAREPLREALQLAHDCGAAGLEELVRTELAATGARPRKAVFTGVESLTPSELRVARIAAEGMTNREIAQALTVTEKTVETHLRHVFQKLDIAQRTELPDVLAAA
jgi:DNA-binding NarL/FixJ family response regulator